MVSVDVIQGRLTRLAEYVQDLKAEQDISFTQDEEDKKTRRYIEHTIQIAIESCLDIGHHIIAEKRLPLPKEHREIFQVLGDAALVPRDLISALQKMVGFRNRMVHESEHVENEFVYGILKKNLDDLVRFGQAIRKYLDEAAEADQSVCGDSGDATLRERRAAYSPRQKRKARSK